VFRHLPKSVPIHGHQSLNKPLHSHPLVVPLLLEKSHSVPDNSPIKDQQIKQTADPKSHPKSYGQLQESQSRSSHATSTDRKASILSPDQDSAGGDRVLASKEKASDTFANVLFAHICGEIWPDEIPLDWVEGRNGPTFLSWTDS